MSNKVTYYSGLLTSNTAENLLASLQSELAEWQKRWLYTQEVCVEIDYQNKKMFSGKNLSDENAIVSGDWGFGEWGDGSSRELASNILMLNRKSELNSIDKSLLENIAKDIESSLVECFKATLITKGYKSLRANSNSTNRVCLSFKIIFGNLSFYLHLTDEVLHSLKATNLSARSNKKQLVYLPEMLDKDQIKCSIQLLAEPISVAQLRQLKIGNVLKLNQRIEEPIAIKDTAKSLPIKGYLVKNNKEKAIYLSGH